MTVHIKQLYLILSGNLTGPFSYTNYLEPMTVGAYLIAPRLQGTELSLDLLTRLGAVPLYVLLFVAFWALRRGDVVFRHVVERELAAAEKLIARIEQAYTTEIEALKAAHERERQQYEIRLTDERTAKEAWKQAWADTIPLAQQGVNMAQQQLKVP